MRDEYNSANIERSVFLPGHRPSSSLDFRPTLGLVKRHFHSTDSSLFLSLALFLFLILSLSLSLNVENVKYNLQPHNFSFRLSYEGVCMYVCIYVYAKCLADGCTAAFFIIRPPLAFAIDPTRGRRIIRNVRLQLIHRKVLHYLVV